MIGRIYIVQNITIIPLMTTKNLLIRYHFAHNKPPFLLNEAIETMKLLLSRILSYASFSLLIFSQAQASEPDQLSSKGNTSINTYSNTPPTANVSNNTYSNTPPSTGYQSGGSHVTATYSNTPPSTGYQSNGSHVTATYSNTPPSTGYQSNGSHVVTTYPNTPNSGYQVNTTQGHHNHHERRHEPHGRHNNHHENVSISINLPSNQIYPGPHQPRPHYSHRVLNWISTHTGAPLPAGVVVGGYQNGPRAKLHICRGFYQGGVHPGKLSRGVCHIGWGGSEVALTQYEVLTSQVSLQWLTAGHGFLPRGAIEGGYQHDGPLFICQANYRGNVLPGKAYNNVCNVAWHNREIAIPYYSVLAR